MQQNDPDARRLPELRQLHGASSRFARTRQIVDANGDKSATLNGGLGVKARRAAALRVDGVGSRKSATNEVGDDTIKGGARNGSPLFLNR